MSDPNPADPVPPFFLIVADLDEEFFCVEGPMTDDARWNLAAGRAREDGRLVQCGPTSPDQAALAAEYQRTTQFRGVPPGSIVRPRG